jgi:hypothetical protein
MKYLKILLVSCLFVIPLCTAASAAQLSIDDVALPCGEFGAPADMPLTLTNAGATIAGVSADITFDTTYFDFVGATIGPAGAAAGKNVEYNVLSPGVVRIGVFSNDNTDVISDGVVAIVHFTLKKNPVGGIDITMVAGASDPAGNPVVITSSVTGGFYTAKTGDINHDGTVTLGELLQGVAMFLGLQAVDPICDVAGDGKVQISDVVKIVNCYLETPACACEVVPTVPYEDLWQESGHADATAMAFNDWNDSVIPTSCAKCHSTSGYIDYLQDGTVNNTVPPGEVITCTACHNQYAQDLTSVVFESTGDSGAVPPIPKVTITGLGKEARCMVCHQFRASTDSVNAYIRGRGAAMTNPDAVDAGASTRTSHYLGAAGVQYGTEVKVGYQYAGKAYDAKFAHVEGYDTCITCHDPHSLELKYDKCVTCHTGATDAAAMKNIRMKGSLEDYDGDGDISKGIYYEVAGVKAKLMTAIQQYAHEVSGVDIGYDPNRHSYWTVDANGDGVIDPATETTNYNAYTARLLKATYNYMLTDKDPGSYAHGGKYVIELMYDSIEDLNAGLAIVVPAVVPTVDLSTLTRNDEGHFNGSSPAWRHWDPTGPTGSCAKCHAAKGIPFFLTNGVNIQEEPANGMLCVNCHTSVTDTVAPRLAVKDVTFPSGKTANMGGAGATDDSNLCILCHQGRAWKGTVDAAAPVPPATTISFSNIHYYAAAASLFGTQVQGGYEYSGMTYAGQNPYASHGGLFNKCVQCHMGDPGLNPAYKSHRVTTPNPNNCVCHIGDVSQIPGDFAFENIRPATGFGSIDFDGDGNKTESLKSEIEGLEAILYARIQAYALANGFPAIVYDASANPYWFVDTNGDGIRQPTETTSYKFPYEGGDKHLLKACYNYQVSQKEPCGYIHNALYIAQLLADSTIDLGGTVPNVAAWR